MKEVYRTKKKKKEQYEEDLTFLKNQCERKDGDRYFLNLGHSNCYNIVICKKTKEIFLHSFDNAEKHTKYLYEFDFDELIEAKIDARLYDEKSEKGYGYEGFLRYHYEKVTKITVKNTYILYIRLNDRDLKIAHNIICEKSEFNKIRRRMKYNEQLTYSQKRIADKIVAKDSMYEIADILNEYAESNNSPMKYSGHTSLKKGWE